MKDNEITLKKIGLIKNSIEKPQDPSAFSDLESTIVINKEYADALYRLQESKYIQILFYFHESVPLKNMIHPTRPGRVKGNFASRSPHRINPIGLTTVQLKSVDGNTLKVVGLDAINDTPVLDIKPYSPRLDEAKVKEIEQKRNLRNPRADIVSKIKSDDKSGLLRMLGSLHGHYCPGVALGLQLSMSAMKEIREYTEGIHENLLAIVEMNNCGVDAVQYITGCTLGNNSLVYRDLGKNALTLVA